MNAYYIILIGIGVSYGLLSVIAGVNGIFNRRINFLAGVAMTTGGMLIIVSIIVPIFLRYNIVYLLILGIVLIQSSAISNGLNLHGRLNPKHHIIRLGLSIFLIVLSFIS